MVESRGLGVKGQALLVQSSIGLGYTTLINGNRGQCVDSRGVDYPQRLFFLGFNLYA
jgi:hypothetical protein